MHLPPASVTERCKENNEARKQIFLVMRHQLNAAVVFVLPLKLLKNKIQLDCNGHLTMCSDFHTLFNKLDYEPPFPRHRPSSVEVTDGF